MSREIKNYSLPWLLNKIEEGTHFEYLLFWGHTPKQTGVTDKSCFSQWYPAAFIVDGISYKTTEHWMMAKKAQLFKDNEVAEKIIAAEKPAMVKALGREVKNFVADVWEAASYGIVVEGNLHKFSQHAALAGYLINSKEKILVEASPDDTIWGIGLPQDANEAAHPSEWRGNNLLGFALMEVRDELK